MALYYVSLAVIPLSIFIVFYLVMAERAWAKQTLSSTFGLIVVLAPIAVPFLLVNIWGIVFHKGRRLLYSLSAVILLVWCYYGLGFYLYMRLY